MSLLNDLDAAFFCDPTGKYSATKIMASTFHGMMLNAFWHHDDKILANWDILALFVVAFLAPDILKKVITMRLGGAIDSETTRTTITRASTSTDTSTKAVEK